LLELRRPSEVKLMPMLTIENKFFGNLNKFDVGDLVSWSKIGGKESGVVSDLFFVETGGRQVSYAKVFGFKTNVNHDILCLNLSLVSKNTSKVEEN